MILFEILIISYHNFFVDVNYRRTPIIKSSLGPKIPVRYEYYFNMIYQELTMHYHRISCKIACLRHHQEGEILILAH